MGTVTQWLDPKGADVFTTVNPPEWIQANGTNFPKSGYAFDGGTSVEALFFEVPAVNYGASNPNLTLLIDFYTAATSNATVFQAAISATSAGDAQSMLTDAFATATNSGGVTSNATANGHKQATITISNTDGLVAGDRFTLKVFRDPTHASDTNTSDAIIFGLWLQYPDT
jgi:hypothetical protein